MTEEHVLVSVRHVELGNHIRAFRPNEKVSAVYDWVGSLSPLPEYFHLYLPQPRRLLSPSESIIVATKQSLNMCIVDSPPPLDPDDSVISVMGLDLFQVLSWRRPITYTRVTYQYHLLCFPIKFWLMTPSKLQLYFVNVCF